ncbi:hypothetical protein M413DRAFT_245805 [Hebeloma cylindrosporum]|uniref:Uncharacterized protein n=1 Tax=Hebeloma cylindrosporum TaxID=76867 RepID=A0A0C3BP08_HEBCY|nr:hypothetical protein M413DRAFT_245805 [Hebeloma cylindrosporum h7]
MLSRTRSQALHSSVWILYSRFSLCKIVAKDFCQQADFRTRGRATFCEYGEYRMELAAVPIASDGKCGRHSGSVTVNTRGLESWISKQTVGRMIPVMHCCSLAIYRVATRIPDIGC